VAATATAGPALALFDLDGTLTRSDTLLQYLVGFLRQHPQRIGGLQRVLPVLMRFALGLADHGAVKSAAIRAVLGGRTRQEIEAWTDEFVPQLLERGMHADALAALDAHRRAGDLLVLLSASPDLYVPAIGRALGFAETVCTGVEWNGERLTGRLTTPNQRGPEKAHALAALHREHPGLAVVAFGNAASDLEHLSLADRATLVNGSARARRAAARLNIDCVTWR
jgi:phosphatidylglycerophosphatase C